VDDVFIATAQVWRLVFALRFERESADGENIKRAADRAEQAANTAAREASKRYQNWRDLPRGRQ
jgi:hypothetical protein